jgi:hypothetical protein
MLGTILYGSGVYGGRAPLPAAQPGQIQIQIETDSPSPPWEPVPVGNEVVVSASFTTLNGDIAEPTAVSLRLLPPSGGFDRPAMERVGYGLWQIVLTPGLPGRWKAHIACSGMIVAAAEAVWWMANSELV